MEEAGGAAPTPAPRSLSAFLGNNNSSANSNSDSSKRPGSAARTYHLAREGIAPATHQFLARGAASASPGRRSQHSQQQQPIGIPGLRSSRKAPAPAPGAPLVQMAPRREWVPISSPIEGSADWLIASSMSSGVAGLMGLHVVAEASKGCCLVIVHKPDQARWICAEGSSGYNVSARMKTAKGQHTGEMVRHGLDKQNKHTINADIRVLCVFRPHTFCLASQKTRLSQSVLVLSAATPTIKYGNTGTSDEESCRSNKSTTIPACGQMPS